MKTVHVAVAVIENEKREILVARRPDHLHMGGFWEFPGGKIESGETVLDALRREIDEELAVDILQATPFLKIPFQYPDKSVLLDVWHVSGFAGDPRGREGQAIKWVNRSALGELDFPPANRHILTALSLSERMLVTGNFADADECIRRIKHAIDVHGIRTIRLRAHHLHPDVYGDLVKVVLPLCHRAGVRLIADAVSGGVACGADGLHFTAAQLMSLQARPVGGEILAGASCHNETEIMHAEKIGLDYICLSPVQSTSTHPGQTPLGWKTFTDLAMACSLPVFALGGVNDADLDQAKAAGAFGIAAISVWW